MTPQAREVLTNLLHSPRPSWLSGNAGKVLEHILLKTDDDGFCYESKDRIAYHLGISESTVGRTLNVLTDKVKRRKERQVLVRHSGSPTFTGNVYAVQCRILQEALLPSIPMRSAPSDEADFLTLHYYGLVKKYRATPRNEDHNKYSVRVKAGWEQYWASTIQMWLDSGLTQEQARRVIDRGFWDTTRIKAAARGPHTLNRFVDKWKDMPDMNPMVMQSEMFMHSGEPVPDEELKNFHRNSVVHGENARRRAAQLHEQTTIPMEQAYEAKIEI